MTQPESQLPRHEALLQKGISASQRHNSEEALKFFRESADANPTWGVPHFLIGSEHAASGEFEQAEAAFSNAVLLSPDLNIARFQLGVLQFSSGRAALALVCWQSLLQLPNTDPLPYFVRGYAALAQNDFVSALHHYRSGVERNTANPALSDDIKKIMSRIAELVSTSATPSLQSVDTPNDAESDASHVLLSNYLHQSKK